MSLKDFQTAIELDKLYKISLSYKSATDQLKPNLFVNTGSVDVYSYNGATEPEHLSDMTVLSNISGINPFSVIPNYIAIKQNASTTTELVLSGIDVELIGAIA